YLAVLDEHPLPTAHRAVRTNTRHHPVSGLGARHQLAGSGGLGSGPSAGTIRGRQLAQHRPHGQTFQVYLMAKSTTVANVRYINQPPVTRWNRPSSRSPIRRPIEAKKSAK